ncbi:ribosomal protein S18-alanine N-acetyltransferase [Priestia koreensis]|uniref:[Ribosomal protein bS18]-alanine N-acetyltransferase n=1 Tax=Priestia koreensis TaxID=284581 RepID=A0A0M0KTY3_9BACI|nr:ribosomal protein S18-alanine N-acetyltransferase [Priestia koreensis]KOO42279.1 alanine acetyltransferase [Priestia koreensis]MCM3007089.1 ribosomal protein S18-alanine N-acetyltransferase [Priestia koreensis]
MNTTVTFRMMDVNDIDQVVGIEQLSFSTPWSKEAFVNELTQNQFSKYVVMEENDVIIGYCGLWVIIDEGHITNVAILPSHRGQGLGEKLMRKVMELSMEFGARTLTLEVRVSNHVAQSLYKKLGFEAGGLRRNYYTDSQEDALVMWVKL